MERISNRRVFRAWKKVTEKSLEPKVFSGAKCFRVWKKVTEESLEKRSFPSLQEFVRFCSAKGEEHSLLDEHHGVPLLDEHLLPVAGWDQKREQPWLGRNMWRDANGQWWETDDAIAPANALPPVIKAPPGKMSGGVYFTSEDAPQIGDPIRAPRFDAETKANAERNKHASMNVARQGLKRGAARRALSWCPSVKDNEGKKPLTSSGKEKKDYGEPTAERKREQAAASEAKWVQLLRVAWKAEKKEDPKKEKKPNDAFHEQLARKLGWNVGYWWAFLSLVGPHIQDLAEEVQKREKDRNSKLSKLMGWFRSATCGEEKAKYWEEHQHREVMEILRQVCRAVRNHPDIGLREVQELAGQAGGFDKVRFLTGQPPQFPSHVRSSAASHGGPKPFDHQPGTPVSGDSEEFDAEMPVMFVRICPNERSDWCAWPKSGFFVFVSSMIW